MRAEVFHELTGMGAKQNRLEPKTVDVEVQKVKRLQRRRLSFPKESKRTTSRPRANSKVEEVVQTCCDKRDGAYPAKVLMDAPKSENNGYAEKQSGKIEQLELQSRSTHRLETLVGRLVYSMTTNLIITIGTIVTRVR